MSLLKEIENQRLGVFGKKKEDKKETDEESKVLQVSEFLKIVRQVFDLQLIDKKTVNKNKENRFRFQKVQWDIQGLLGNLTPSLFALKCANTIEGMLKNINHSQGNGDWRMAEYEVALDKDGDGLEVIVVGAKFVDLINQPDLQYQNGIPAANVNVSVKSEAIPKEVLSALSERSTDDDELKGLLKQLITVMASDTTPTTDTKTLPQGEEGVEMT
jgi:hypothetical protein